MLITAVFLFDIPITTKNLLVFCCSAPLLPMSMLVAKIIKADIFSEENPLGKFGLLFTTNQLLYPLIVMWAFSALPEKMAMVHAMAFGAHLLPYSWLYKSKAYRVFAIAIPLMALLVGHLFDGLIIAAILTVAEIIFVSALSQELKQVRG